MIINPETGKPFPQDYFKDYAKGKPCQVRIANECGHGGCAHPDTTVLAHPTMAGLKAMSGKLIDLLGAWACDTCHALIDGRLGATGDAPLFYMYDGGVSKEWFKLRHHEGVARTIDQLHADGILRYEKDQY